VPRTLQCISEVAPKHGIKASGVYYSSWQDDHEQLGRISWDGTQV